MNKYFVVLISFLFLFLLSLNSCKDANEPNDEPPALPPSSSSMVIDFSDFSQNALAKTALPQTKTNWWRAVSIVAPWKLILDVTLFVPVISFTAAMNQTPEHQQDGSWLWSYDFGNAPRFTAELYGKIADKKINWDMYITKQGFYSKFHWFYGESNLDGSGGKWTLNHSPGKEQAFLQIDWTFNASDSTGSIRYTALNAGDNTGSYIDYRRTKDTPYDRYFSLLDLPENHQIDIQWNFADKTGRIADSLFFGNSDWHCWASNLEDADCPK